MARAKALKLDWTMAAAAAGVLYCIHKIRKIKPASGIGAMDVQVSVLNKAKKLFDAYDKAVEIAREQDAKADAIYDSFEKRGIDPFANENEKMVIDALYRAGLCDKNVITDVYANRRNARKELLNYVNDKIISIFPIPASDRKLLKDTISVVYQDRLLGVTRDFVNKQLENHRKIREIFNDGVGKVLESDYSSAVVTTKDGRHAVQFIVIGDQISVSAMQPTSANDRDYMGEWEFWDQIGYYTTLSGAKRGAKRWMERMGYELSDKDLNKI